MTDMREAIARAIVKANWPKFSESDIDEMWMGYLLEAEAALSLMQPEIDRRVAEERAKLLERLRVPSETILGIGAQQMPDYDPNNQDAMNVWQAMLTAFQQENSDGR